MICSCRSIGTAIAVSWLATAAAAQALAGVRQSASVDLAALATGEIRLSVEPVVLGHSVLGVSLGRWWGGGGGPLVPVPVGVAFATPGNDVLAHPAREYMVDLYVRVYPEAFSARGTGLHVNGYLGAFLGLDDRERDQTYTCAAGYACPLGGAGTAVICACPLVAGSGGAIACPCPQPPPPQSTQDRVFGVEPGVELGVRASPTEYLMLELGAWARLITFPDPTGRFEEGQIDPRLTVSVGVRW